MKLLSTFLVFATAFLCQAEAVKEKVDILDIVKKGEVEYHLNPKAELTDSPEKIFQIKEGMLHISGRGYGYMATKEEFSDYHLTVEFKWGAETWGKRIDHARDNGILVHAHGPHGAMGGTWIASIEAQIIEGGMGDIIIVNSKEGNKDGVVSTLTSEIRLDRDGEKCWKRGAPKQRLSSGRINWEKRDPSWKDVIGFRGKDDLDAPLGKWNRLEVIAKDNTLQYKFNGEIVNEATEVSPSKGRICIQTEAAEMIVRKFELKHLKSSQK